jgi:hypothetical protein
MASNNDDLALVIALCSSASSLIVVLITSAVSLASKKIDVQLRKNDQGLALQTTYLTRKFDAGEKAVEKLTLILNSLLWLKSYMNNILSNNYLDGARKVKLKKEYDLVMESINSASYATSDTYFAYFKMEKDYNLPDNIIARCEEMRVEIESLVKQMAAIKSESPERKIVSEIHGKIKEYVTENDKARSSIVTACEQIRKQMVDIVF